MSGNIWRYDIYDLRKFYPRSIDAFLDIGGCVGTTSVLFKSIDPFAHVVAVEACKENFIQMQQIAAPWGIKCHNLALGDGAPMCFDKKGQQGAHCFYSEKEKQWWPKNSYTIESKSFPEIFNFCKIPKSGRYIVKIDCEGGERFVLYDNKAIELLKGAVQINIELHKGFGGSLED